MVDKDKNFADAKKLILEHKDRTLFRSCESVGHFNTSGYYTTDNAERILENTFENKLHQSKNETKKYYSILKNEILSYGARPRLGTDYEIFLLFEKSIARISVYCGKIRLRLEFNKKKNIQTLKKEVKQLENSLVSSGYIELYIDTDEHVYRAIDLISVFMRDLGVRKIDDFQQVDYISQYPLIENATFLFIEDETQKVPELVVSGLKKKSNYLWWILLLVVLLLTSIGIGACALIRTRMEEQSPVFDLLDKNGESVFDNYIYNTTVDIFDDPWLGGKKIIYPGRQSVYSFYISNSNSFSYTCALTFEHENLSNINMKYRLKIAGVLVTGYDEEWMTMEELNQYINLHHIYVSANSQLYCELEWKWEDSDSDTQLGIEGLATYTLRFTFSDFVKAPK